MSWYHAASGQQAGPFTEEQFRELITNGTVQPATLVWEARLPNWVPLAQVPADILPQTGIPAGGMGVPPTGAAGVLCGECGRTFPAEQVIRIADRNVCATCKPTYMQKLREGAAPLSAAQPGAPRYAGFWIRFAAKFIDGLIVGVPIMVLSFIASALMGTSLGGFQPAGGAQTMNGVAAAIGLQLGIQGVSLLLSGAYTVFFVYKYNATPGKMAVGLRIYMADGTKLSLGRCIGRYFAEILSGIVCYIGYIIAGFDAEKRSLHDHICNTRVVYK